MQVLKEKPTSIEGYFGRHGAFAKEALSKHTNRRKRTSGCVLAGRGKARPFREIPVQRKG